MKILLFLCLWMLSLAVQANDGVYFVSGNQLFPAKETDIAITKEVLTISLQDDGYALVDVQYEFMNRSQPKSVLMGFEADRPYNAGETLHKDGAHPQIFDFTVVMNGEVLRYKTAVVESMSEGESDFKPIDLNKWKVQENADDGNEDGLYNASTKQYMQYAYSYYFTAHFKKGINRIHHTYRFSMSSAVGTSFIVNYWLKPAMRWANRQIDDFTLRIKAENTMKYFFIADSVFQTKPFKVVEGDGKVRKTKHYDSDRTEIVLRNGVVEWHQKNFKPTDNLNIVSCDSYMTFDEELPFGSFYDRSEGYMIYVMYHKDADPRIIRNLPYASRGYVFKDKYLQKYFSRFFWYMPNPDWEPSTVDFTPSERRYLKNDVPKID